MTTTYTNQQKYSGQSSITYNESSKTYDQAIYQYNGVLGTVYTNQTKN